MRYDPRCRGAIGGDGAVLRERGVDVRVVGRDVRKLADFGGSEQVAADVATREGCDRALAGVDAAVYSLGLVRRRSRPTRR